MGRALISFLILGTLVLGPAAIPAVSVGQTQTDGGCCSDGRCSLQPRCGDEALSCCGPFEPAPTRPAVASNGRSSALGGGAPTAAAAAAPPTFDLIPTGRIEYDTNGCGRLSVPLYALHATFLI